MEQPAYNQEEIETIIKRVIDHRLAEYVTNERHKKTMVKLRGELQQMIRDEIALVERQQQQMIDEIRRYLETSVGDVRMAMSQAIQNMQTLVNTSINARQSEIANLQTDTNRLQDSAAQHAKDIAILMTNVSVALESMNALPQQMRQIVEPVVQTLTMMQVEAQRKYDELHVRVEQHQRWIDKRWKIEQTIIHYGRVVWESRAAKFTLAGISLAALGKLGLDLFNLSIMDFIK